MKYGKAFFDFTIENSCIRILNSDDFFEEAA